MSIRRPADPPHPTKKLLPSPRRPIMGGKGGRFGRNVVREFAAKPDTGSICPTCGQKC